MQASEKVLSLLKSIETKALKPYLCAAGKPTISYGVTYYENGAPVKLSDTEISEKRCEQLFTNTIKKYNDCVNRVITKPMLQQQFDAFFLMCYNCGVSGFVRPAQVAKYFNLGDFRQVEEWWPKSFITANGKVSNGLINRRKCELNIFCHGVYKKW